MMVQVLVLSFLILLVSGCKDSSVNRYASRAEAATAGAIDRGWVPDFIPESASEIIESHSVDANHSRIEFSISREDYVKMLERPSFSSSGFRKEIC